MFLLEKKKLLQDTFSMTEKKGKKGEGMGEE